MTLEPADRPMEVLLEHGGHVIVTFSDPACRREASDPIAALLVVADGSERDLEEAIRAEATDLGLVTASSRTRHTTLMVVGWAR